MSTHLENDLENVKLKMFEMADMAIDAIRMSVESLKKIGCCNSRRRFRTIHILTKWRL